MTETTKFLAPETVNMLVQRANSGGFAGFQVGDEVKYIIKYKPVPNGGNTGTNGYVTDYIPNGMQVVGAGFALPDGFGGYYDIAPPPAGDMANHPDGSGNRYPPIIPLFTNLPATPANLLLYENNPSSLNGPIGNTDINLLPTSQGTMAQFYADVGIWYSTDIRTAFNPLALPNQSRNAWDLTQINYENICAANNGGAEGSWGTGSPVAGPETFYQREIPLAPAFPCTAGPIGPWHRIAHPGSRIGDYGLMSDLQASRELFAGDPLYGRDVAASPLPATSALTPVTIRWANGLNSVGEIKYVWVRVRIASLPPSGTIINESEVWGGDVFYGEGGKDNPWKYNNTLVSIGNNSDLTIIKQPSVESAQPGDVVSFQVTVINTGAGPQNNVVINDYLQTSTEPKPGKPFEIMSTYNCDATGGAMYGGLAIPVLTSTAVITPGICPALPPIPGDATIAGAEGLQWTIPSLAPGASQTYTYSVTALTPPNPKVSSAADHVVATSTTMLLPGAASAASFEIGTFPLLVQSKTATPSSVLPGGTVRYHIHIVNNGSGYAGTYHWGLPPQTVSYPFTALGLPRQSTIEDTLPAGFAYAGNTALTISGAPVLGATVAAIGNKITWSIPHTLVAPNEFAPGSTFDLYFDATVSPGLAAGVYTNSVISGIPYNKKPKAGAPANKDWASKPLYTVNTAPVTVGAVQMSKTASPSSVTNTPTGTSTAYTITITNNGAAVATGVAVTDTLPADFSYQNGSTSGTAGVGAPVVVGQAVTWSIFNVPANSARTIIFNADIASTALPAAYFNDVTATATNATIPDLIRTAPVVVQRPGVTVSKTVDKPTISWLGDGLLTSDTVNYTITLTNSGTGYGIVDVSDTLPAGFFYPQLGTETVTMAVAGVPTVLTRLLNTNTATTYGTYPGSVVPLPLVGTRTLNWGTFTIPPKQAGQDSTLTIQFAARVDMQQTPLVGVTTVTQLGIYNNTVTVAGNSIVPVFTGAPVDIVRPVTKWTTTPNVAVNGLIDYRFQVANHDAYTWTGVSVVDYLGTLTTAGLAPPVASGALFSVGNAFYAAGLTAPVGMPGVDAAWLPTVPLNVAPNLTFNNGGAGFTVPAGQNLFVAYKAIAPAAVPVPATIHNSIQTLSYTSNLVAHVLTNVWDGVLAANTAENVSITLTPSVSLTAIKTATPSSLYIYNAAAPSAVSYTITLTNPDILIPANGVTITDTLPPGFSFGVGDTATVSINGAPAVALLPVYTPPVLPAVSGTLSLPLGANIIPAAGNAVITFTTSVAALTPANTYYNNATWLGTNVNVGQVGPTAPVTIDPVTVTKQALTPSGVVGSLVKYRVSVSNAGDQPLNTLSLTDTFGNLLPLLASGFTYNSDIAVTMNGTAFIAGVDYTAPIAASVAPVWAFSTPVSAGTAGAASTLNIDFYANVPPTQIAGMYNNSVSSLSFTPGILAPVVALNAYDGGVPANTSDDVVIQTIGISKAVVNPYATVINDPVLGTLTKYIISVSNTSAAPQLVDITDTLPAGFSYQLGSTLINGVLAPDPVLALQTLTWAAQNALVGTTTIQFTALIAGTVAPATYNNQANVLVGGLSTAIFSGAPVTVTSPQTYLSKITTTPNIGKDSYANFTPAHYKLTMTNLGSADALGVTITDTLPVGFAFDPYSVTVSINGVAQTSGTYAVPAPLLSLFTFTTAPAAGFTIPAATLSSNGLLVIEYDAVVAPATVPLVLGHTNSAISASTNAGAQGPATSTVFLYDVGLSKTTTTPTLDAGQTATYTIIVSNFSPLAIPNVKVSDFLPVGLTYTVLSTTGLGWVATEPLVVANHLDWTIPSLAANTTATITFNALVANTTSPGTYRNSVVATGNFGLLPTVPFPNTGPTAPIVIASPQPILTVLKSANALAVTPGSSITYTVVVTNTGSGQANTVVLNDFLSVYTKLALNPFANGTIYTYADGANPSGLTGTATVTYSNDNGVTFVYIPIDDGTGHDSAITNVKLDMGGPMNANQAANPSFQITYQVEVK
ncbi:MAG: hypothetical protein R8M46_05415 [Ghiorsea sp.]